MDYSTFCSAFSHNRRTLEHLTNLTRTRVDGTAEFALLLGAGASVTSGVIPAQQMIDQWRKTLFASYKGTDNFNDWLLKQDWHDSDDEYARLFEFTYDQPSQRRAYIENAVRKAKPGWGYAYLVSLISKKLFNVVFTTNFDDLINDACYMFSDNIRPIVCAHDSAVSSIRVISERPKVIKLHGDFLYDSIKNTSSELQSLENNMRDKFTEFARGYGLIVCGYSGSDKSVMDLLDVLVRSNSYFRHGIYWCIRRKSVPCRRLRQLLRNDRVFWLEVDGYDQLMADIASATHTSLPAGVTAPHLAAFKRTEHLLTPDEEPTHLTISRNLSDLREVYDKVKDALSEVGLETWQLDSGGSNAAFMRMTTEYVPYLRAVDLIAKDQVDEACTILRPLIEKKDATLSSGCWQELTRCFLIDQKYQKELRDMLAEAPPTEWQDSSHYLHRSYLSLAINDAENALLYANRALELNRQLKPALVNKALALHMLAKNNERNEVFKVLEMGGIAEHHAAAICAMKGDFDGCILNLQKAFVLGRYSVKDACRDVAFRVFWSLPRFETALQPFKKMKSFLYPYLKACPMSEAEIAVRTAVESK